MMSKQANYNYKYISFWENRRRLKLLIKFKELVKNHFDNISVNMMSGGYIEETEASEARVAIDRTMYKVYKIIKLAKSKSYAGSSSSRAVRGNDQKNDLILNMFNRGNNNIQPEAAINSIEKAIDVYKLNYERRKKTWFCITISKAMAFVLVVMTITSFINTNEVPQHDETIKEISAANSFKTGSVSDSGFVPEESYKPVSYANKAVEAIIDDAQYAPQSIYTIQTGSFLTIERSQKEFDSLMQKLHARELDYLRIEKVDKYYSVRLGKFEDYTNTATFLETIKPQLSSAIIMKAYIKDDRIIRLHQDSFSSEIIIAHSYNY